MKQVSSSAGESISVKMFRAYGSLPPSSGEGHSFQPRPPPPQPQATNEWMSPVVDVTPLGRSLSLFETSSSVVGSGGGGGVGSDQMFQQRRPELRRHWSASAERTGTAVSGYADNGDGGDVDSEGLTNLLASARFFNGGKMRGTAAKGEDD